MRAAEQLFEKDGEYTSLIWLDHELQPLIFIVHDHGWWKGFPDLWKGELVRFPHPGTVQGFAFLIDRANLSPLLGSPSGPERPYQAEVVESIGSETELPYWEITHPDGRLLRLEWPNMNVHVTYT